jgi:hypothetical protein
VWFVLKSVVKVETDVGGFAFFIDFASVWIVTVLAAHSVMRIPFIRWRFRGGQFL